VGVEASLLEGRIGVDLTDQSFAVEFQGTRVTGPRVARVDPGGPAWQAGLRSGDILVNANDTAIANAREFMLRVAQTEPGTSLELVVFRGGQMFATSVTLIQQPPLAG
jgi:S1-C subfamily serine protease